MASKTPSDLDIAWMAGIYEGEGCISSQDGRTIMVVSQKDPELLFRCRELFGGSITEVRKGTKFNCHAWKLYGDIARNLFIAIYPYMTSRRKMQIEKGNGLRLTGKKCNLEMNVSEERKAKRAGMTAKQRQVESVLHYNSKNSEKVKSYQRGYAATVRERRKEEVQQTIQ